MQFINYNANPKGRKTTDCVIRALSIALDNTWEDTYISLVDFSIKQGLMINDKRAFSGYLKAKGYENIKDGGKYLTMKTPYFSRNVRVDRAFGDKYSVQGIKERIYRYSKEELPPVANFKKKYYRKLYTGPKINKFLLQTSSLYRLYVHYLYAFKILLFNSFSPHVISYFITAHSFLLLRSKYVGS